MAALQSFVPTTPSYVPPSIFDPPNTPSQAYTPSVISFNPSQLEQDNGFYVDLQPSPAAQGTFITVTPTPQEPSTGEFLQSLDWSTVGAPVSPALSAVSDDNDSFTSASEGFQTPREWLSPDQNFADANENWPTDEIPSLDLTATTPTYEPSQVAPKFEAEGVSSQSLGQSFGGDGLSSMVDTVTVDSGASKMAYEPSKIETFETDDSLNTGFSAATDSFTSRAPGAISVAPVLVHTQSETPLYDTMTDTVAGDLAVVGTKSFDNLPGREMIIPMTDAAIIDDGTAVSSWASDSQNQHTATTKMPVSPATFSSDVLFDSEPVHAISASSLWPEAVDSDIPVVRSVYPDSTFDDSSAPTIAATGNLSADVRPANARFEQDPFMRLTTQATDFIDTRDEGSRIQQGDKDATAARHTQNPVDSHAAWSGVPFDPREQTDAATPTTPRQGFLDRWNIPHTATDIQPRLSEWRSQIDIPQTTARWKDSIASNWGKHVTSRLPDRSALHLPHIDRSTIADRLSDWVPSRADLHRRGADTLASATEGLKSRWNASKAYAGDLYSGIPPASSIWGGMKGRFMSSKPENLDGKGYESVSLAVGSEVGSTAPGLTSVSQVSAPASSHSAVVISAPTAPTATAPSRFLSRFTYRPKFNLPTRSIISTVHRPGTTEARNVSSLSNYASETAARRDKPHLDGALDFGEPTTAASSGGRSAWYEKVTKALTDASKPTWTDDMLTLASAIGSLGPRW